MIEMADVIIDNPGAHAQNGNEVGRQDQLAEGYISMLNGCVAWNGIEAKLPTGALMPPAVNVLKLIKSWDVLDAESDEGFRTVKTADLKEGDAIIGCKANNNSIARIILTYGADAFRFTAAAGQAFGIKQWIATFGTNPFEVLAIMRKNKGGKPSFKVGE
jgi:hypothetical protein